MAEYIFIIIAVSCFAAQFAFTKLYEEKAGQSISSTLVMIMGTSFSGAIIFFSLSGFNISFTGISMMWAIFFAIIMIPYYLIGVKILSLGSLAIYSMFMMLGGMLVPFFYGVIFLNESISVSKAVGTVLLTVFIVLQAIFQDHGEKKSSSKKSKYLFFILCITIFFINGMTGVIAKAHSISQGAVDEISFTATYSTMTAFLGFLFLLLTFFKKQKTPSTKKALTAGKLIIMILLGAASYGGNFFLLLAADKVPASVQFPLVSGGVILLSCLVSLFIFKEKPTKLELCCVLGSFLSTFLFAF